MAEQFIAKGLHYRVAGRAVIDDVSLALEKGELVALIGPNGAGKSTLLRLLTGFLKPAIGRCVLAGKPLDEWHSQTLSRHRAVMRQQTQLGFDWPVEAVIAMGRAPWTQRSEPRLIAQVMEMTGCTPLAGRQYAALSGGEQQRVQLARALAQLWCDGAPRGWLFLDEPTSALDLYHQQHLLRLLKTLTASQELHVCIVLHDLNLAALWADRIVLLHNGRLVSQGTPEAVLQADDLKRWYGAQVHVGQHPANGSPQVFLAP
ncbi:heme ABC transporter ATP-binding protein [Citrobacter sp. RHBSTW-00696]|uniref:heme ABC transporter ATP-binding protein n=1 Tax=Citrobacter TaxID=544 RepID=UPI000542A2C7|nr:MULTISPECIES: heme ABC transporter ATP-binding protein [Citrobacter]EIV2905838.1 heme ABC transporter ATP-binding protein [Citrobacter braakii]KHE12653.1 hemin importer ATP-binding subunit [Citrobacter braakii]MBA8087854.1 heme ABC transporter ATP-binding protein [Citrobacter sp. RHBSTW-00089]MBD9974486.1 heme ABC transporter ATP-binding protein [Citrobacter braakii]MBS9491442.1 heme ABC transporter ATP-binding protein [Citrobacter braakii]